jgi:hypothetical protein
MRFFMTVGSGTRPRDIGPTLITDKDRVAPEACAPGRRRFYEKPSEQATREKAEAARRARKLARKQAIRDGLIAAPKKSVPLRKSAAALSLRAKT